LHIRELEVLCRTLTTLADYPEQLARSLAPAKERYLGVITDLSDLSRAEGPEMELHNSDSRSNRCREDCITEVEFAQNSEAVKPAVYLLKQQKQHVALLPWCKPVRTEVSMSGRTRTYKYT
jgi:hypothetical protein